MSIAYLQNQGRNIDAMSIYNSILDSKAKESLEKIGGMEYIDMLYQSPASENLDLFAKQVYDAYILRQIYQECDSTVKQIAENPDSNSEQLLAKLEQRILDLTLENATQDDVYKMGSDLEEKLEKRAANPLEISGLPLGMPKLDKALGGVKPGDLLVVVGESKSGKSVTLLNWTKFIGIDINVPILYIDTEMYDEEQEDRLTAIVSQVPEEEIINGTFATDTVHGAKEDKIRRIKNAVIKINQSNIYHIYMPDFTIEKVKAMVRKYQIQHNIGAVVFDYIKLPSSQIGSLKFAQEYQMLGFITSGLKDIAGTCQIPIISAAQENRTGIGSTKKDATNIGGSYRILQLASKLVFLRNKTDEEMATEGPLKGNQKMKVAYQRRGGSDLPEINIFFDKPRLIQREV